MYSTSSCNLSHKHFSRSRCSATFIPIDTHLLFLCYAILCLMVNSFSIMLLYDVFIFITIVIYNISIKTRRQSSLIISWFQLHIHSLFALRICQCLKLLKHLWKLSVHLLVLELTCANLLVTTTAILEHKTSDIHCRCTVENAVSACG